MLRRSKWSKVTLLLMLGAALIGFVSACSSNPPIAATPSPQSAPILTTPPPEVGNGLVCAAAADRLLGIADGIDLRQFTWGASRPQSVAIQQALARYLAAQASDSAARSQAAGLIQGQCAAYGFYVTTYKECVRATMTKKASPPDVIRGCIDRRRWTVYTQQ